MSSMSRAPEASTDQELRRLEAVLDEAIERARQAKQAVKEAKAEAKRAKRERKRARRALIEAQQRAELSGQETAGHPGSEQPDKEGTLPRAVGERVADSPEQRHGRSKRRSRKVQPSGVAQNQAPDQPDEATLAARDPRAEGMTTGPNVDDASEKPKRSNKQRSIL